MFTNTSLVLEIGMRQIRTGIKIDGKKGSACVSLCMGEMAHPSNTVYGPVEVKRRRIKGKGETEEEEGSCQAEWENQGLLVLCGSRLPGLQHDLPVWCCVARAAKASHGSSTTSLPTHSAVTVVA